MANNENAAAGILLEGTAKIKLLPGALRVIAPEPGAGAEKPETELMQEVPAPVAITVGTDDRANHNDGR